ncbi:DUF1150 family protein [Arenibacterium halophilum]|uniref:DUF1150 family protein n=1 Tax=Arenibacterium halophilum TaxID=2583821 RepID=A0ABY2X7B0_9RHOB|nr:DUF1150 family protein [Arenibacterium halophilum]TMV11678.1 DUF1150 family protein [Arenibacterium halophilum]
MNTPMNLEDASRRIVYVKPIAVADLPQEVQDEAGALDQIYAVHNSDGEQLALVANRQLAFSLARQHDYAPVSLN